MPVTIFFCYARKDKALLDDLKAHLQPLQRQGLIEMWDDGGIPAGTKWEEEISKHLNAAQIILLLVSPSFMNSDYCYSIEMKRAVERDERKEACVIPVILEHVYWQVDPLSKLQALPTDGEPVVSKRWHSLNEALLSVTKGIYKVVEELMERRISVSPLAPLPVEKLRVLRTLTGHTSYVSSVAISSDGRRLFSGSYDKTIKVWDVSTGREVRTLTGHTDTVYSIAVSSNGQQLFSASGDQTIKVWDVSTGREVRTLTGHTGAVWSVAISSDGQRLFSGSNDNTIKGWDVSTGREVRTFTGHTYTINSIAISSDGQRLFSASSDKTIKVWEVSTEREIHNIITGNIQPVVNIAISADEQRLFSVSYDNRIQVWDVSTGHEVRIFAAVLARTVPTFLCSVAISGDGQWLFSGALGGTIKVWDLSISGALDGTINGWNESTGREVHTLTGHTSSVNSIAISADGQQLFSGSSDNTIKVWRA